MKKLIGVASLLFLTACSMTPQQSQSLGTALHNYGTQQQAQERQRLNLQFQQKMLQQQLYQNMLARDQLYLSY